jgi:hypothetical protein
MFKSCKSDFVELHNDFEILSDDLDKILISAPGLGFGTNDKMLEFGNSAIET